MNSHPWISLNSYYFSRKSINQMKVFDRQLELNIYRMYYFNYLVHSIFKLTSIVEWLYICEEDRKLEGYSLSLSDFKLFIRRYYQNYYYMDIPGYLQILLFNTSFCYRINQNKMGTSDIIVIFDISEQIFAKRYRVRVITSPC